MGMHDTFERRFRTLLLGGAVMLGALTLSACDTTETLEIAPAPISTQQAALSTEESREEDSGDYTSAPLCVTDEECDCGNICVRNQCGRGSRSSFACDADNSCAKGEICVNNYCMAWVPQDGCTPGATQQCYDADDLSMGVGVCRDGVQVCLDDGTFSACFNQVIPAVEVCDGLDNDCDGQIDEDNACECRPGARRHCFPHNADHTQGECRVGLQHCQMDNTWGDCAEDQGPTEELCDGLDNDCDGQIDEDITCECMPGKSRGCSGDTTVDGAVGECTPGTQICLNDFVWSACLGEQGPVHEACDGLDNDCDGQADEDFPHTCGVFAEELAEEEPVEEEWPGDTSPLFFFP